MLNSFIVFSMHNMHGISIMAHARATISVGVHWRGLHISMNSKETEVF